jgi:hypothetical protein
VTGITTASHNEALAAAADALHNAFAFAVVLLFPVVATPVSPDMRLWLAVLAGFVWIGCAGFLWAAMRAKSTSLSARHDLRDERMAFRSRPDIGAMI